jgi:hypothetical protein
MPGQEHYTVNVWMERDRRQLSLETSDGQQVFCLSDEDFEEAITDGFLVPPRHPRPSDDMWLAPAIDYATSMGLITH